MELPQLEQALLLAEMARERSELSVVKPKGDAKGGAHNSPTGVLAAAGTTGLLPLALAWEGSALALLAARGEIITLTTVLVFRSNIVEESLREDCCAPPRQIYFRNVFFPLQNRFFAYY